MDTYSWQCLFSSPFVGRSVNVFNSNSNFNVKMYSFKFIIVIFCLFENILGEHAQSLNIPLAVNMSTLLTRSKRQTTYTCRRETCRNGVCSPLSYKGTNPPSWCRNVHPHKQQIKCSWSHTCWSGKKCELTSSNCGQTFEDLRPGRRDPKTTFNFSCDQRRCSVETCKGSSCAVPNYMSTSDFQQRFVNGLPNCSDVEGRRGKRAPATVQGLLGYCCDIQQRWGGGMIGSVRPIRR
ncbi:unnamed protein product [Orchesella dallaii]|uniref:Uncharacterized protein n=1 Tax=Orchesella dallaii TaxID=48710 RepID=A0ABP1RZB0_9HEXA